MKRDMSDEKYLLSLKANHYIKNNEINALINLLDKYPNLMNIYKEYLDSLMLYDAAYNGYLDLCKVLVSRGANIDDSLGGRKMPLNAATKEGHFDVVKWLLDNGALIDGIKPIATPLMFSIMFGHSEIAKYLIERGADLNAVHLTQNKTPLDYTKMWGLAEIEKMLIERGAISVSKPIDWKTEFGGPILKYVNDNAGSVLPISFMQMMENNQNIFLRIAQVNKKQQKYLFTIGLFAQHKPMLELFLVLPALWNLNDKSHENMFPCVLLLRLSRLVISGTKIQEGDFISSNIPELSDLKWPTDIEGFWISDYEWKKDKTQSKTEKSDSVTLYTLIPEKKTKAKKKLIFDSEKCRNATWGKICLDIT